MSFTASFGIYRDCFFWPSHHQEPGEMGDLYTPWEHFFPWKTRGFPTGKWTINGRVFPSRLESKQDKLGAARVSSYQNGVFTTNLLPYLIFINAFLSSMSVMKPVIKMQVSNKKKKWWIKVQQTRGQWLDRMGYMGILTNAWELQAIRTWICLFELLWLSGDVFLFPSKGGVVDGGSMFSFFMDLRIKPFGVSPTVCLNIGTHGWP